MSESSLIFDRLYLLISERIKDLPPDSRVAAMHREGLDRIAQKVGEEAVEVVIASKNKNKKRIIEEMADLYFMTLVLLSEKKIPLKDLWKEMESRNLKIKNRK